MSKPGIRNQAIALAGLLQAVKLVQQVAEGQPRDTAAVRACFTGVSNTEPEAAAPSRDVVDAPKSRSGRSGFNRR